MDRSGSDNIGESSRQEVAVFLVFPAVVDSIVTESECVRERYSDGPELAFELSTNLATARG